MIAISTRLSATPELQRYTYEREHLSIEIIYRYKNDIKKLYFESLTENLNDYLDILKSQGKLNRGKIHFEIMTAIWMDKSIGIEMYRYKSGYYCWLNGLVQPITQKYLTEIIDYFTSDTWESFCYNESLASPLQALTIFNKRIASKTPGKTFKSKKVMELNYVSVHFQNDSLICKSLNRKYGQVKHLLPFSKNLRDFITCGETIYVIEKNEIINQIELTDLKFTGGFYEQCWVEVFPKWINFGNRDGFFLSYSTEENRFYKL